jgi:hypothetical protein
MRVHSLSPATPERGGVLWFRYALVSVHFVLIDVVVKRQGRADNLWR